MLESMNQQEFNDFIKMELATVEAVLAAEERVMCVTHETDDDDDEEEINRVVFNERFSGQRDQTECSAEQS